MNLTHEMEQLASPLILTIKAQMEYNAIRAEFIRHIIPQLHTATLETLAEAYHGFGPDIINSIQWENVYKLASEHEIGAWNDIEIA